MNRVYQCLKITTSIVWIGCLSLLSFNTNAAIHPKQQQAIETINQLYHSLNEMQKSDMTSRLDTISAQFLGKPYVLGALGEGSHARFDQEPRYRTDAFDCETYVTTVLALALANDTKGFKQCLSKLRYHNNGQVSYITRNHFTELDWNLNNQRQGFVKDITESFLDKNKVPVAKIAKALIDKPSWYQHFTLATIRLQSQDKEEQTKRLAELKSRGSKLPRTNAELPYIPLTSLFNAKGEPNQYLFAQIPDGAIIEIVRPNWNLREQIGTNLNVSHLGFAFWKKGVLTFRQASSIYNKVVDVSLIDYLKEAHEKSPTIKGINVQIVVPKTPLTNSCGISA
ncbi:N-acetylmuramoyl-L-alanine amidase-like domain-containing protein [Legionella tunisiensis]|uniref:N-acetylmuramoyl-L-alanine amidase-like domain-containing protein n=1 Tax=Legionella tunisiensis TaxID=1034944 RepID=UPI0002EC9ED0|nr:N-acetylmuramoyl-L-alanine amidase-like domain-containing protein [Legionella tunisiensis]